MNNLKQPKPLIDKAYDCMKIYPQVLFGALSDCGVTQADQDYEDLRNEAQIAFLEAYCHCLRAPVAARFMNFSNVLGYVSQAVKWQLKHELRNQRRVCYYHGGPYVQALLKPATSEFRRIHALSSYHDIACRCNDEELQFLRLRLLGCDMVQIADHMGVSKRKVYGIRRQLQSWAGKQLVA
jgi:hypothetical protein